VIEPTRLGAAPATGKDVMPEEEVSPEQVEATIQSRGFIVLLGLAAIVGVLVSLGAWCFLELVNQIQRGVYVHLPSGLGYHHGPPLCGRCRCSRSLA